MSSIVDEIEAELKQISPWPWAWCNGCSWWRLGKADDQMQHDSVICPTIDSDGHPNLVCRQEDREFLAKSPERLAALCRYVRAAEAYLNQPPFVPSMMSHLDEYMAEHERRDTNLQSARAELGIGKE